MASYNGQQDRPVGELMSELANQTSTLVKQELDLAKAEMTVKAKEGGKGAGFLGGAGVAGLLTLFFLSLAATYLLDNWIPVELAALLVAVIWGIVAAVLAARGRKEIKDAEPQLPTTQQTLKEDVQWARAQKS